MSYLYPKKVRTNVIWYRSVLYRGDWENNFFLSSEKLIRFFKSVETPRNSPLSKKNQKKAPANLEREKQEIYSPDFDQNFQSQFLPDKENHIMFFHQICI